MPDEPSSRLVGTALQRLRKQWGWSQAGTARRLRQLSASTGVQGSVSAGTVSRWERGMRRPRPRSQVLLRQLFAVPPSDSEFSVHVPLASLLPDARATLVQLLSWWLDTTSDDARWLGPVEVERPPAAGEPAQEDPLARAVSLTALYRQLTEVTSAREQYQPALTQLHALAELAIDAGSPTQPLAHAVGCLAQLISELAFDQRQQRAAVWYAYLAVVAAQEAGDRALEAYAFTALADAFLALGLPRLALEAATRALPKDLSGIPAALQACAATVEAEMHACQGDEEASDRCHRHALVALAEAHHDDYPAWVSFCEAELDARLGRCDLLLGRLRWAQITLEGALKQLDPLHAQKQASLLVDLAATHLAQGRIPEACQRARQALDLAIKADSEHCLQRVDALAEPLFRRTGEPAAMELLSYRLKIMADHWEARLFPPGRSPG